MHAKLEIQAFCRSWEFSFIGKSNLIFFCEKIQKRKNMHWPLPSQKLKPFVDCENLLSKKNRIFRFFGKMQEIMGDIKWASTSHHMVLIVSKVRNSYVLEILRNCTDKKVSEPEQCWGIVMFCWLIQLKWSKNNLQRLKTKHWFIWV